MKKYILPFQLITLIVACFIIPENSSAQSVSIGTISASSFCAGDPISVNINVSGFWGHRNAFTLQLSDPTGSFANGFQNIGSIADTLPGTYTIISTIPTTISSSFHYRLRILGAIPYFPSVDNGQDISIGRRPLAIGIDQFSLAFKVGSIADFQTDVTGSTQSDTAFWDYGSGANPETSVYSLHDDNLIRGGTIYTTPGEKKLLVSVVAPGGCSITDTVIIHAYDCSTPVIPKYAKVIDTNNMQGLTSAVYWVNPGVTFSGSWSDTIFAEPGSTIGAGENCIIYLKHGAEYINDYSNVNTVIYADGASLPLNKKYNISCPTLDFDYTNAPPNAAHPLGVKNNLTSNELILSPNPTTGMVAVHGLLSDDLNVSVLNLLGETMIERKNLHSPDFTLDLSKLVRGAYYIRFSSANSVVTKKIIKN